MDQKNTIVKCANNKCLFNYAGICDQYAIKINKDGKCNSYIETESNTETKCCHDDCIHFDDSDMFVGPQCLFKHPEPLKAFYEGMPCDYYHKKTYIAKEKELSYNKIQKDQMCWYCDHGKHGKCKFSEKPLIAPNGVCCRFTSTGGNR